MLYILHFDKNDVHGEIFIDEEMRLDLGRFPSQNTHIRLRMVGWNSNQKDADIHLSFPDLSPQYFEEEEIDAVDEQEVKGMLFSAEEGSLWGDFRTKTGEVLDSGRGGRGAYGRASDNRVLDLHLGTLDTQKDYFRVIVNARRGSTNINFNGLNNVSILLEVHHGSVSG